MIVAARTRAPRAQNYRRNGMGGAFSRGHLPGMGIFTPPATPNYQDPGYPPDPAIVAANEVLANAYDLAMNQAQANNNNDQCLANAQLSQGQPNYDALVAACGGQLAIQSAPQSGAGINYATVGSQSSSGSAPANGGKMIFTTSRGGTNALQVGDTWQVQITGASPNSPVTVSGSMPGGTFSGTSMGSTDNSGNFSKSGTFDTSTVGSWQETWAVGGAQSGTISFTVAAATTPAGQSIISSSGAASGGGTATGGSTSAGATSSTSSTTIAGFDLSSIPWWGWLAAGGAVLYAMKGAR